MSAPTPEELNDLLGDLLDPRTRDGVHLPQRSPELRDGVHALLYARLKDRSLKVREEALRLLAWSGADKATLAPIAIAACSARAKALRRAGLWAILHSAVDVAPAQTVAALIPRLTQEPEPDLRSDVVSALGWCAKHWTWEAVAALEAALDDPDPRVRDQAAYSFFEHPPYHVAEAVRPQLVEAMVRALQHPNPKARQYASLNLPPFAPQCPAPLALLLDALSAPQSGIFPEASLRKLDLSAMKAELHAWEAQAPWRVRARAAFMLRLRPLIPEVRELTLALLAELSNPVEGEARWRERTASTEDLSALTELLWTARDLGLPLAALEPLLEGLRGVALAWPRESMNTFLRDIGTPEALALVDPRVA